MDDIRKKSKHQINLSGKKLAPEPESQAGPLEPEDSPFIEKFAKRTAQEEYLPDKTAEEILLTEEREEKSFPELEDELSSQPGRKKWIFFAAGMALLITVGLISSVFARLTVTVKLKQEAVALQDIAAVFDTSVSRPLLPQRVIPGEKFEMSEQLTQEFPATGKKNIAEPSRGKAKVYNAFSSAPQALVANTRFLTDAGTLFRLARSVTIPAAEIKEGKIVPSFIEVELVADAPGEGGNIREGLTLKIPGFKGTPKYDGFYAITAAQFSGGYIGEAKIVTSEDLKKAQEEVTQKLYDTTQRELAKKVPPDFKLLDQFREIQITKVTAPKAESRLDNFTVEAKAVAKALVFREADVKEVVKNVVIKTEDKKELVEDSFGVQYRVRAIDFEKGRADVSLTGEVKIKPVLSPDEFASLLSGKKEGSIIAALQGRAELASFRLAFFPPWRFSSPGDPAKVRLIIDK